MYLDLWGVQCAGNLLGSDTSKTEAHDLPGPWILQLGERRPEAVLLAAVLLKLDVLGCVLGLVALFLVFFGALVAAHVTEEDVVCQRSHDSDGVEWPTGAKQWERKVNESITKVAVMAVSVLHGGTQFLYGIQVLLLTWDVSRCSKHHHGTGHHAPSGRKRPASRPMSPEPSPH